jgi:uncharacterized Zn finger protein
MDGCKHVAAVLYGVGARLDEMPRLLFVLRDVDESELLASVEQDLPLTRATLSAEKVCAEIIDPCQLQDCAFNRSVQHRL